MTINIASKATVLQNALVVQPNKNLIYNGAMQVAQRGTSTTGITAGGYYTADRWFHQVQSQGTWTDTIENDAPTGSGFRKSWKTLCTTADAAPAASDVIGFDHRLEGQDLQRIRKGTSSAQQLTLSFWVKSNVTGTYVAHLADQDNSRQVGAQYTIAAANTWEKKTITFPADTTGAFDNDNALSLTLRWFLGAGTDRTSGTLRTAWASTVTADLAVGQTNLAAATNNYWQITGVQLEVGDTATEFEFKTYGQELRECQRYYFRSVAGAGSGYVGYGNAITTTTARISLFPKVTMRTRPTAVEISGATLQDGIGGNVAIGSTTLNVDGDNLAFFQIDVASGLTAFRPYTLAGVANGTHYAAISAEL